MLDRLSSSPCGCAIGLVCGRMLYRTYRLVWISGWRLTSAYALLEEKNPIDNRQVRLCFGLKTATEEQALETSKAPSVSH